MSGSDTRYVREVTATAGGFSEPVYFPRRVNDVTVQARPGSGGQATVYFTLDELKSVFANPNAANWDAWDAGAVSSNTSRALAGPVTALRIGAVTADAVMKVVGAYDF